MVRLWVEHRQPSSPEKLFNATDAFAAFHGLLFTSGIYPDDEVEATARFIRACRILSNRNLVRLAIVQYPFDSNQPYRPFRTQLGYIKALYHPQPYEGLVHAESVQKTRRRLSSA